MDVYLFVTSPHGFTDTIESIGNNRDGRYVTVLDATGGQLPQVPNHHWMVVKAVTDFSSAFSMTSDVLFLQSPLKVLSPALFKERQHTTSFSWLELNVEHWQETGRPRGRDGLWHDLSRVPVDQGNDQAWPLLNDSMYVKGDEVHGLFGGLDPSMRSMAVEDYSLRIWSHGRRIVGEDVPMLAAPVRIKVPTDDVKSSFIKRHFNGRERLFKGFINFNKMADCPRSYDISNYAAVAQPTMVTRLRMADRMAGKVVTVYCDGASLDSIPATVVIDGDVKVGVSNMAGTSRFDFTFANDGMTASTLSRNSTVVCPSRFTNGSSPGGDMLTVQPPESIDVNDLAALAIHSSIVACPREIVVYGYDFDGLVCKAGLASASMLRTGDRSRTWEVLRSEAATYGVKLFRVTDE